MDMAISDARRYFDRISVALRALAAATLVAALLGGCETLARRHERAGPEPIPPEVLASLDTTTVWVGGPRAARGEPASIGIVLLWDGFDPRCIAMMPAVEAWHEAYGRYGLRIVALHFTPYSFAGDTAVVGAASRRLGLRFPSAVVSVAPPAALAAGHGPVVLWPGGGDSEPQWLSTPSDANAFEARLRARLRKVRPESNFPADTRLGVVREAVPAAGTRLLALGTDRVERGPLHGAAANRAQPFVAPFRSEQEGPLDTPVPVGGWTPRRDLLEAARGGAANVLVIRYDAGPVGVVAGPPAGAAGKVWILQDEHWIQPRDAGPDLEFDARGASYINVTEPRLYAVTRGGSHVLKLSPEVPGVRFYSMTFEAAPARP